VSQTRLDKLIAAQRRLETEYEDLGYRLERARQAVRGEQEELLARWARSPVLAERAAWFHAKHDLDVLLSHTAKNHDAWALYAAWHAQADQPVLMSVAEARQSIAEYIDSISSRLDP
jgi:hypothetical protein